jgi:hypothetical protein
VRSGVCGTDLYFILYSSGIFDWSECCVTQNHAITLVGYDTDPDTGADYWIALNRYFVCCLVVVFVFSCCFLCVCGSRWLCTVSCTVGAML